MILKDSSKNAHSKMILFTLEYLNPQQALFCKLPSRSCVTVNIIISSLIELIKQTWSPPARKGSQTEGF